jgi:threonylcarbamoyladenosine tRNA methylthiotransferase MtaB
MSPRVSFKTIGCRLNQAETAQMTAGFIAAGYEVGDFDAPSDVAVVHGCAITHKAERDSVRSSRIARRGNPQAVIILTGCPAEAPGNAPRQDEAADLVVGQAGKFTLPGLLHRLHPDRFPAPPSVRNAVPLPVFDTCRALVKVQDGCDFRCAYCIVPLARGAPHSRPLAEVAAELDRVAAAGFREVVLTGANLGRYEDDRHRLVDVIRSAESVPGIARIRLSSIELTTAERAIIDHMAASAKLCRFLHIPLQSGDNDILRAMGRRYTAEDYRQEILYATDRVADLGLGTDIIVGFPGETAAAFENTLRVVESLPFSNVHVFPYSSRAGTRAAGLADPVASSVKKARVRRLRDVAARQRAAFAGRFTGRTVTVLIEGVTPAGTAHGWTGEYLQATLSGDALRRGQIVAMRVAAVEGDRLQGQALAMRPCPAP